MGKKKFSPIRDTLGIEKGGLYAIYPFDNIDDNGYGLFKVGMAEKSLHGRIDHYITYYPEKVFIICLLEFKNLPEITEELKFKIQDEYKDKSISQRPLTEKQFFNYLENECHAYLKTKGATQLYSKGRVTNPELRINEVTNQEEKVSDKGMTEWLYCKEEWIIEWFKSCNKQYSTQTNFWLRDEKENTSSLKKTDAIPDKFIGEITFNLKNKPMSKKERVNEEKQKELKKQEQKQKAKDNRLKKKEQESKERAETEKEQVAPNRWFNFFN